MRPLIARRDRPAFPPDPAPSRLTYRAQRLWLTPLFRTMLRVGLPAFIVAALVVVWASDEANRMALSDGIAEIQREIEDRPEFRVTILGITGASPVVTEEVRQALALDLPVSSFDLDLEDLRARVEALPAVRDADLRVQTGGYLSVAVAERVPVMIWQTRDGPVLIDAEGAYVAALSQRTLDAPLPTMAGDRADEHVTEALRLIEAAEPLQSEMIGLVWMGERRWDIVLDGGRRILLPSHRPADALDRVLALHDVTDLLGRDVVRVDLRNPDRLTVQLTPEALTEYRRLRELEVQTLGGDQAG
ncbi:MAG: cell division protein FtsQ/DivIB [Pseudomonadota bacterium]